MNVTIQRDNQWGEHFSDALTQPGSLSTWKHYNMGVQVMKEMVIPDFKGLVTPKHLPHVSFHDYQIEAAKKVMEEMNGKAILADEVGLGKTIEAGLILKEYMIRGLVTKVLILSPASLVTQWCQELNEKFFIPAVEQRKKPQWESVDVMVTSIDTAKKEPHAETIKTIDYDMIIIDEAHKLKNKRTKNYQFARQLNNKFCLLLTATPIQNKLSELYYLISLLKPGYLGSEETFSSLYKSGNKNEELHQLIQKVMIRNRRETTNMEWTKRIVKTIPIHFSEQERKVYESITQLKTPLKEESNPLQGGLLTLTMQRELCSSREAAFMTLKQTLEKIDSPSPSLVEKMQSIMVALHELPAHPKAMKVVELLNSWEDDEKVVVFTEYRATQLYLQWYLSQHGITSVPFRGGFKRGKKDWMKQLFKNKARVLIATEAGGEGINLQFCHRIINYDLPWNPMRIEQRIGRLHRLGQESDVYIYHLAIQNTIENHILQLLYKKIGLFEGVIGELDHILEKFNQQSVQEYLSSTFSSSETEGEIRIKMEHLASLMLEKNEGDNRHATS